MPDAGRAQSAERGIEAGLPPTPPAGVDRNLELRERHVVLAAQRGDARLQEGVVCKALPFALKLASIACASSSSAAAANGEPARSSSMARSIQANLPRKMQYEPTQGTVSARIASCACTAGLLPAIAHITRRSISDAVSSG